MAAAVAVGLLARESVNRARNTHPEKMAFSLAMPYQSGRSTWIATCRRMASGGLVLSQLRKHEGIVLE